MGLLLSVRGLSPPADVPWEWTDAQDWDVPLGFTWVKLEGSGIPKLYPKPVRKSWEQ